MRGLDQVALTVGVDPEYLRLLQQRETGGTADPHAAVSDAGALGALQVMPLTGKAMADKYNLDFSTPEGRVEAGARYYKELLDEFEDPAVAAAAYHSGPTKVRKIVNSGGNLATDLGPVGRDYYKWFNERAPKAEKEVTMPQYREGQTATNPQTGEKFAFQGGAWVPQSEPPADSAMPTNLSELLGLPEEPQVPAQPHPYSSMIGKQNYDEPSLETILETAPALGGAGGALLGGPVGAGIGGVAGEGVRQGGREALDLEAAPGIVANALGLEPGSWGSRGVDLATEGAAALGGEKAMAYALSKVPGLKTAARRMFAGILDRSGSEKALRNLEGRIAPIEDVLPVGGRGKIEKIATKVTDAEAPLTKKLETLYGDQPSSYVPAYDELSEKGAKLVKVPIHERPVIGDFGEELGTETVQPFIKDKPLHKALRKEADRLKDAQQKAVSFAEFGDDAIPGRPPVTRKDVRELRMQAGQDADAAGAYKTGATRKMTARAEAQRAEQAALSNVLHGERFGAGAEGKAVDEIWSSWKTVADKAVGTDPGMFPVRWILGRIIPGNLGASAGFMATKPAFWASISSKTMNRMAKLIEAGSDVEAEHLLRSIIRDYEEKEE